MIRKNPNIHGYHWSPFFISVKCQMCIITSPLRKTHQVFPISFFPIMLQRSGHSEVPQKIVPMLPPLKRAIEDAEKHHFVAENIPVYQYHGISPWYPHFMWLWMNQSWINNWMVNTKKQDISSCGPLSSGKLAVCYWSHGPFSSLIYPWNMVITTIVM